MLEILLWPFVACLILTGIHCYLGLHIVRRGVIFVDLALAQIAALGVSFALTLGYELNTIHTYIFSLSFTFVGAGIFSLSRFKNGKIPQEAIIGIVYAVSSAMTILMLEDVAHGLEEIKTMLVGSILFVIPQKVFYTFIIYCIIGIFHFIFRKKFFLITTNIELARERGIRIKLWDFLFYITFGFVVTSSVQIAGILLVFSYLVIPAVFALFYVEGILYSLFLGWGFGLFVSLIGLWLSWANNWPTGASLVSTFGVMLLFAAFVRYVLLKKVYKKRESKC